MVFERLNGFQLDIFGQSISFTKLIANVLNVIVLTAALSVYNSSVYSNSRMLYGLAQQGNAPKFLSKLNKNYVPVMAILVSAVFAAICIVVNKIIPEQALSILMSLVVSALVINWLMISYTHIKFRKAHQLEKTKFPSFLYPISNYICLFFLVGILIVMWLTGLKMSVELIPIWMLFLYGCYYLVQRKK